MEELIEDTDRSTPRKNVEKSMGFSFAENELLVKLYMENRDCYHAKFSHASRNGLSNMDRLASEWADLLSQCGLQRRTIQQIKRRILDMGKAAMALMRFDQDQLTKTGGGVRKRKEVPSYIRTLAYFLAEDVATVGFDSGAESGYTVSSLDVDVTTIDAESVREDEKGSPISIEDESYSSNKTDKISLKNRLKSTKRLPYCSPEELRMQILQEELQFCKNQIRDQAEYQEARMQTEKMKQEYYASKTVTEYYIEDSTT